MLNVLEEEHGWAEGADEQQVLPKEQIAGVHGVLIAVDVNAGLLEAADLTPADSAEALARRSAEQHRYREGRAIKHVHLTSEAFITEETRTKG